MTTTSSWVLRKGFDGLEGNWSLGENAWSGVLGMQCYTLHLGRTTAPYRVGLRACIPLVEASRESLGVVQGDTLQALRSA